ncbi:unnamed protein product [Lactuca saligna]|uniref:Uncharacterized protein n=1 Tax=Lactuca saligna TaxID=75948 RepID=A0AA35ZQA6_LACSI|nr:unnamed protein product [Lactuca saligna]
MTFEVSVESTYNSGIKLKMTDHYMMRIPRSSAASPLKLVPEIGTLQLVATSFCVYLSVCIILSSLKLYSIATGILYWTLYTYISVLLYDDTLTLVCPPLISATSNPYVDSQVCIT